MHCTKKLKTKRENMTTITAKDAALGKGFKCVQTGYMKKKLLTLMACEFRNDSNRRVEVKVLGTSKNDNAFRVQLVKPDSGSKSFYVSTNNVKLMERIHVLSENLWKEMKSHCKDKVPPENLAKNKLAIWENPAAIKPNARFVSPRQNYTTKDGKTGTSCTLGSINVNSFGVQYHPFDLYKLNKENGFREDVLTVESWDELINIFETKGYGSEDKTRELFFQQVCYKSPCIRGVKSDFENEAKKQFQNAYENYELKKKQYDAELLRKAPEKPYLVYPFSESTMIDVFTSHSIHCVTLRFTGFAYKLDKNDDRYWTPRFEISKITLKDKVEYKKSRNELEDAYSDDEEENPEEYNEDCNDPEDNPDE